MDADVLVIGGGAAGMAAARALARKSARVILLEARDRLGGRVWPRAGPRGDVAADLGGEFIHGKAPHTFALLREAGLRAVSAGGDSWMSSGDAVERIDPDRMTFEGVFHATRSLTHDESVDRFLRRFDSDPKMRDRANAARAFVEGFDAADPAIASACAIADEWRSGVDTTIARPIGGYGPMLDYLREACTVAGVQTRLSTPVRRIVWRPGSVSAEVARAGGASLTLEARCAVVTVPVGVLRESDDLTGLAFAPELPPAKRTALRSIEMGHAVKVALWFKTAFWERLDRGRYRDAAFFRAEGKALPTYWTQLPERSTLIIAWAGGPRAVALGDLSHAERYERALDGLAAFFGEAVRAEVEGAATHDWSSDPFSRGAYSYVAVGGGDARNALAAPVDATLFFAGEATSADGNGGTVNGALETGERAAAQAAEAIAGEVH